MNVLVTGATGFIGSFLVEALLQKGHRVTCVVRKNSSLKWVEHLDPGYLICDLADIGSCADKLREFEYVFHVAGVTKASSPEEFFFANSECTERLLRAVASEASHLRRFVFLSSLAAAGPSRDGRPVCEGSEPRPVSFYGESKLNGERAVLQYGDRIPVTVIRPPAVYGPRDRDFLVLFKLAKSGIFPHWGQGRYSLIYVEDLVRGIISAAESSESVDKTFFLSDNMVYTNDDIYEAIVSTLESNAIKVRLPRALMPLLAFVGEKMNKKSIINRDKTRELRFSNWTCDAGRARKELGFEAKTTLREGIKWTADWYRIHRWL
jgi:nucleoside-diphosphate-sugar epimerase